MKKCSSKLILFKFSIILLIGCSVDPEEPPTLMDSLVGIYCKPYARIVYGNTTFELKSDSLCFLNIHRDNTFKLLLIAKPNNADTLIIVRQQGKIDIPNFRLMEGSRIGFFGTRTKYYYYVGQINFYPEDQKIWGGKFSLILEGNYLNFPESVKLKEYFKGHIVFYSWRKIGCEL